MKPYLFGTSESIHPYDSSSNSIPTKPGCHLSSIFASAAQSIASGASTPVGSGTSTPTASQSAGPSSMSVMARSKKEFARLKLYASFVRGEVIEFKPSDPRASSSVNGFGNGASSPSGSATPMHQHKIMKSQLWNVQPVPSSSASPSPTPTLSAKASRVDRKTKKALEKAAKKAKKAEKETRRAEKEAKRTEKERRRADKKEKKAAKAEAVTGSEAGSEGLTDKIRKRTMRVDDDADSKEQKKKRKRSTGEVGGGGLDVDL